MYTNLYFPERVHQIGGGGAENRSLERLNLAVDPAT